MLSGSGHNLISTLLKALKKHRSHPEYVEPPSARSVQRCISCRTDGYHVVGRHTAALLACLVACVTPAQNTKYCLADSSGATGSVGGLPKNAKSNPIFAGVLTVLQAKHVHEHLVSVSRGLEILHCILRRRWKHAITLSGNGGSAIGYGSNISVDGLDFGKLGSVPFVVKSNLWQVPLQANPLSTQPDSTTHPAQNPRHIFENLFPESFCDDLSLKSFSVDTLDDTNTEKSTNAVTDAIQTAKEALNQDVRKESAASEGSGDSGDQQSNDFRGLFEATPDCCTGAGIAVVPTIDSIRIRTINDKVRPVPPDFAPGTTIKRREPLVCPEAWLKAYGKSGASKPQAVDSVTAPSAGAISSSERQAASNGDTDVLSAQSRELSASGIDALKKERKTVQLCRELQEKQALLQRLVSPESTRCELIFAFGKRVPKFLGRPATSAATDSSEFTSAAPEPASAAGPDTNTSTQAVPMLEFSNDFECSNLCAVSRVYEREYDLTLWRDYNTYVSID